MGFGPVKSDIEDDDSCVAFAAKAAEGSLRSVTTGSSTLGMKSLSNIWPSVALIPDVSGAARTGTVAASALDSDDVALRAGVNCEVRPPAPPCSAWAAGAMEIIPLKLTVRAEKLLARGAGVGWLAGGTESGLLESTGRSEDWTATGV